MPSHPLLPPEVRLRIYEICLDEYFDNNKKKPGVWVLPARLSSSPNGSLTWAGVHGATIRNPVPSILQVELGDMRARLLARLARQRGLVAVGNSPILRFPDRQFQQGRDILYLHNSAEVALFCGFLKKKEPELADPLAIQRVAVAASVNHEEGSPRFMESFEDLCSGLRRRDVLHLDELLIVFVMLDHGKLVDVTSGEKGNYSAFFIDPLETSDLEGRQDGLQQAVTALEKLVRPRLFPRYENLKYPRISPRYEKYPRITACKIIPRI